MPGRVGRMALQVEGPTPRPPTPTPCPWQVCAGQRPPQPRDRACGRGVGAPGPLGGSRCQVQGAARLHPSPQQPVGKEAKCQQAGAQQVAKPCKVRNAVVIWIQGPPPRQPDRHVSQVQQDCHLCGERRGDGRVGGAAGLWDGVQGDVPSQAPCQPWLPSAQGASPPGASGQLSLSGSLGACVEVPCVVRPQALKPLVQAVLPRCHSRQVPCLPLGVKTVPARPHGAAPRASAGGLLAEAHRPL